MKSLSGISRFPSATPQSHEEYTSAVTADGFYGHRRSVVTKQYNNGDAAAQYVRSHTPERPIGRHLLARIRLLEEVLAPLSGGSMLDAGCGPGILAKTLLESPEHDFTITVLDQSPDMVKHCLASAVHEKELRGVVGDLLALPFEDSTFDITLVTGALEYINKREAIAELSRVTRTGGTVIVSMLNPISPYRIVEWFLYWPALRALSFALKTLRIRTRRSHDAEISGIRAVRSGVLRRHMRRAGLEPRDLVYFDLSPVVPPFDRIPSVRQWAERRNPFSQTTCGMHRWLGRGYIITAERV